MTIPMVGIFVANFAKIQSAGITVFKLYFRCLTRIATTHLQNTLNISEPQHQPSVSDFRHAFV